MPKRTVTSPRVRPFAVPIAHPADVQDRDGAEPLLRQARRLFPFIERLIGDAGYQGPKMAAAVARTGHWRIEIVRRCDRHRFVVLPKRWIVERTIGWIMGGETTEAWRAVIDHLIARGLRRPAFLITDRAPGLEQAIGAVWNGAPVQRCTVHKHRTLLGHAPERLHEQITAADTDMIYAATAEEIEDRRKAFLRKWRLRHRAVADSLEHAGDALFAFTRLPPSQWRSASTTNAIERRHEAFKRQIKTQTVLPSADPAAMLFWALLASGQINRRKGDGWQTLTTTIGDRAVDQAA
jgi:transposase